jgi:TolA-binding protein
MKPHHVFAAAAALAFVSTASAQSLKPGLWEVTNKMQSSSGQMEQQMAQMQQQMASMPPEQRKMVEEMMAKQGVKPGAGGPGGMSVKTCMTKEMVEKNELPAQQGDCKTTHQSRSGNTMKFGMACTNPPSTGEGQVTFISPEAYSMKMVVNTKVDGKPEKMNMDGRGKWLGADCGSIKPVVPPTKK